MESREGVKMGYRPTKIRGAMKCFGGKSYLARRIIGLFGDLSRYDTFVDPTVGGGSIPLNLDFDGRVIVSDIDPAVTRVWRAFQDHPADLHNWLSSISYTEATFEAVKGGVYLCGDLPVAEAARTIVLSRFSRGGLGKDFAWSDRLRGGRPGDENSWHTFLDVDFWLIAAAVKKWEIHNFCMSKIIDLHKGPSTLVYIDPPYPHESRVTTDAYRFEMPTLDADRKNSEYSHESLLRDMTSTGSKFFISSYDNSLYSAHLKKWKKHIFSMPNHSGQGKTKQRRTEILWESP